MTGVIAMSQQSIRLDFPTAVMSQMEISKKIHSPFILLSAQRPSDLNVPGVAVTRICNLHDGGHGY